MEKLLKRDSYYYIERPVCPISYGFPNMVVARYYETASTADPESFWIDFIDSRDNFVSIRVKGQSEIRKRVTPVSNAFNKYLELFQ